MSYSRLASDCAIALMLALPTIPLARPDVQAQAAASDAERQAVPTASGADVPPTRRG